jgi:hypothetical protein
MKYKDPEGQLARWLEMLSTFSLDIVHRAGKSHTNADALSRALCQQCDRLGYPKMDPDLETEGIEEENINMINKKNKDKGETEYIETASHPKYNRAITRRDARKANRK